MPVKRRAGKRRVDVEAKYFVWSAIFDCGWDMFGELEGIGVSVAWTDPVPPEFACEPWERFGGRWMGERVGEARLHPIWAIEQFGRPWERDA